MPAKAAIRTAPDRGDARRRLLDAAAAALVENGGEFEMSEIAARSGASAGLAYHYFGSKSGLIFAVVDAFYDRYHAVANERMDGKESWATRERRRLDNLVAFLVKDPLAPVILGTLSRTPEVAAAEAERTRVMIELSAKNIENGQRNGEIGANVDPLIAGAAILGGIREACAVALTQSKKPDREKLADNLWTFIAGAVRLKETSHAR